MLSVVIITFNEEKNIERCLLSVQEIADEIVVVDSFSTDGTEEICRNHGVRFIPHEYVGMVEQKNWAVAQASNNFVFSIDADEALSEELQASIKTIKENPQADGYYFNRLTNYCGHWIHHGSWYPDRKLRIWDRRKGSFQGENPHDEYFLVPGARQQFLKGDLLHYSYYTTEEHISRINKYTAIQARGMFDKGIRPNLFKEMVNPPFRFIRDYFFKLGLLDGYAGYFICRNSAYSTFLKYSKLRMLYKTKG